MKKNQPLEPVELGVFRRLIRLVKEDETTVVAGVEDDFHAFKIVLKHDGKNILSIRGEALRYPLDTCPGASALLELLTDIPLTPDCRKIGEFSDGHKHCTHLFDLAGLAATHAYRNESVREYEIAIPDSDNDRTELRLYRDGSELIRMGLLTDVITYPEPYSGQTIERGFSSWVQENIANMEGREAVMVLQRARFVSTVRKQAAQVQATKTAWRHVPVGVCYSYHADRIDQARRMPNSIRDLTSAATTLLKFVG